MKVCITGINGFIGRHLYQLLLDKGGYEIRGLAMPKEDMSFFKEQEVEIIRGDLSKAETLRNYCEGADIVFHLAARVTDWGTKKQFYEAIHTATENLLKEAVQSKVKRFVYTSSISACGMGRNLGFPDENSPIYKSGVPYNDAKHDTEFLVRKYQKDFGLNYTIIRPTNVTGANSVWVKDPIARMAEFFGLPLLDNGKYDAALVDVANLVDGIYRAGTMQVAENQVYFLMDDWNVTWKKYLGDLGAMMDRSPKGNLSFGFAWNMGTFLELILNPLGIRSPLTRLGAGILGRDLKVNTQKAQTELGWKSAVSYEESQRRIKSWVEENREKIK